MLAFFFIRYKIEILNEKRRKSEERMRKSLKDAYLTAIAFAILAIVLAQFM